MAFIHPLGDITQDVMCRVFHDLSELCISSISFQNDTVLITLSTFMMTSHQSTRPIFVPIGNCCRAVEDAKYRPTWVRRSNCEQSPRNVEFVRHIVDLILFADGKSSEHVDQPCVRQFRDTLHDVAHNAQFRLAAFSRRPRSSSLMNVFVQQCVECIAKCGPSCGNVPCCATARALSAVTLSALTT